MVDMQKLTHGVLHTKFWVVDQTHFYLGSANMDWRSLTQVCLRPIHPSFPATLCSTGAQTPTTPLFNPRVLSPVLNGFLPTFYQERPQIQSSTALHLSWKLGASSGLQ